MFESKYVFIILLALLPISVYGKTKGGCYISALTGMDNDSVFYKGAEFGCEGSRAKDNWLGGYLGTIILDSNERGKDVEGFNIGVRKNFTLNFAKGYKPLMPYVGFGGIVTINSEKINESGDEYTKVNDIAIYSFSANTGIKVPISRYINIIPNMRYVVPIRIGDSSVFVFGVSLHIGRGK